MRRAAFGVARQAIRLLTERVGGVVGRRVVLLVGAGNNGGDALWAGVVLRERGASVTAVLLDPDRAHAEGLTALRRVHGRVIEISHGAAGEEAVAEMSHAELVIDGIVGLSGRGPLRVPAESLVRSTRAPILAVDLPSGVDPDTGAVDGPAVSAEVTVTFACRKPAHVLSPGAQRCGEVVVVDIGLDPELPTPDVQVLDDHEVGAMWPIPRPSDDKYSQGVVGLAAGSAVYPGAAVLAAGAAVHASSGLVRYAGVSAEAVRARYPEIVTTGTVEDAGQVQAWAVGPGLGTGHAGAATLRGVLEAGVPVCVDADGLNLLANQPDLWDARDPDIPLVLTPHDREFARLTGHEPGEDRIAAVRAAAKRLTAVVLLKGHSTIIAAPDGRVLVNRADGAWAATAGSGDVLTGIIGALLAAGLDPLAAAGAAARAHSVAASHAAHSGDPIGVPVGASAIVAAIPSAVRALRRGDTAAPNV